MNEDDLSTFLDRFDRLADRMDRFVDRLDRVLDRQNIHTSLLREIKNMTQANNQDVQALVSAVQDLSNEVTDGLGAVDSRFSELQSTIDSLTSLNDQERQALQDATASVRSQITNVSQSFSRFKANPDTPVEPTPTPGDNNGPAPAPTPDPEPVPNPSAPETGPVAGEDQDSGGLSFN